MLRQVAILLFGILAAGPKAALGGEIDPDHFGVWAPVGQSCKAEPRIEVTASEIVIYHQGKRQRFEDLDESYDCYSGSSVFSIPVITTCVYPWWGRKEYFPFILIFNPEEKRNLMVFELENGDPSQLPKHDQLFRRCFHRK